MKITTSQIKTWKFKEDAEESLSAMACKLPPDSRVENLSDVVIGCSNVYAICCYGYKFYRVNGEIE